MKNAEIIKLHNGLAGIQKKEKEYEDEGKGQLLGGKVKVTYAIRKNMKTFLDALKPYNEEIAVVFEKLCDDKLNPLPGKEKEFKEKTDELLNIDVEDVKVHKIGIEELEGLPLSTFDIDALMFMIKE